MVSRIINSCISLRPDEIIVLCSSHTYNETKKVVNYDFRLNEIYTKIKFETNQFILSKYK